MAEPENPFLARAQLLQEQGRLEQEAAASAAAEAAAAPPMVAAPTPIAPSASAPANPFAERAQQLYTSGQLSPVEQALSGTLGARPGPTTARAELQGTTRMGPTVENAQALSILNGANQFLSEGATPEVLAEVRRIARETGDSLPLAAQTYVERAALAERDRGAALLAANPALAALVDRRGYADLARDLDGLAAVEQVAESTLGRFVLSTASRERIASDTGPATDLGFFAGSMARMERFLLNAAAAPSYTQMTTLLTDVSQIGMSADEIYASMVSARGVPEAMLPAWDLANIRTAAQMQADRLAQYTEADIPDMIARAAEDLTRVSQLQELGRRLGQSAATTRFTAELDAGPDTIGAFFDAAFRNPVDAGQFLAETMIESAPILAAGIVTGGLTGSITAASLAAGGASFSLENVNTAMEYLAEQGYQIRDIEDAQQVLGNAELMAEAERRGLARGLIIGTLDALSGGIAGAALGRTPLGDLVAQTVVQGGVAGGGEILGSLAATGTYSPQAALLEALADVGTTPIEVAGIGLRRLGSDRRQEQALNELLGQDLVLAQERADAAALDLETTRAAIEDTATFDRDPEAVRELLVEAGDQDVSIPTAEIDRLYQEGVLTDDDIEYLQLMEEMTAEGELSGEVAVPASRVLTLPGDGFGALVEHVRPTPGDLTVAEAREATANRDADIERLEGVLAQAEAAVGEVNTLADTIFRQVRATQTVGRGPARALGRLLAERYAARAALFEGVTATQLYEQDQVTFAGPGAPLAAPLQTPTVEQAAADLQQTPEFQQFFGNSAVVDESGAPLVVYHGTQAEVGADFAFDPNRIGSTTDAGFYGSGFYFSPDEDVAFDFGDPALGDPTVIPTYVSLQNPFMWDARTEESRAATAAALAQLGIQRAADDITGSDSDSLANSDQRRQFNRAVREAGYDGVLVYSKYGDDVAPTEVVAFSPEQIKAISNVAPTSAPGIFEQAAADVGTAQTRLAEDPASLGLDAELAASVNPIYRPEALPPGRMQGSNREAAEFLESTYADEPIIDLTAEISPERLDRIATQMAAETELALESSGNAADWYSAALDRTLSVAAVKYPMLTSDAAAEAAGLGTSANARFLFTYIMATTSQNLDVAANAKATDTAFSQMIERWQAGNHTMDTQRWGTGDKQKAMNENFAKFNRMLPNMPGETAVEQLAAMEQMFRRSQTVGEWTAMMSAAGIPYSPPGQTAVDAVVYGSSTLGPKIGNGFWQNLNGNFSPLTIDLWMRRTWGRLTGKSIGLADALPGQRERLKAAVDRSLSRRNNIDDYVAQLEAQLADVDAAIASLDPASFDTKKGFNAESRRLKAEAKKLREIIPDAKGVKAPEPYKAAYNTDSPALLAYAKRLLKVWDAEYKRLVAEHGKGNVPDDLQPTWARAAKTIKANLGTPLDQVANGTQRRQIETAGQLALEKLAARGINVTMADMQALLWYPEKELWTSLTRKLDVDDDGVPIPITSNLNESYDAVFTRILGEQGYDIQGTAGAAAGRAGERAVFEQPSPIGDRDQGPDGGAVQGVRGQGRGGRYTSGGLAPLEGAPRVEGAAGPDIRLVNVAEKYAADNGIDLRRQGEFVEVDPTRAAQIAQAYEDMEHAPQDPAVQEAYQNLISQTIAQYEALVEAGYQFYFFDENSDPYAGNPWNAMRDLRANQRMGVFSTEAGFGSGATDLNVEDNPMLADTGIMWPYGSPDGPLQRVLANDLFRAVHDAFGHGLEGAGFRARGEENAWQAHVRLFTGSAVAAITSETRGQNSWLNYGPFGETNRTASVEDTVFADQKTGLMPEFTWTEGRASDEMTDTTFEQPMVQTPQVATPEFRRWFAGSQIVDDVGNPLVVYHGTLADINSFDPAKRGSATRARDASGAFFFAASSDVANTYAAALDPYTETPVVRTLERITGGLYSRFNETILKTLGLPSLRRKEGSNVLPVVLAVKNPLEIDLLGATYNEEVYADAIQQAKEDGYDGVIFRNADDQGFVGSGGTTDIYAVFEPNQVKSVFNARPTTAPGLLEQPVEGPQTETKGAVGAPRGSYRLPTNDDPRNIINLTANSDPSTLVHEVGHMFLFQMTRDLQSSSLTEDGRAQLEQQITATKAWFASNAEQAFADLKKLAADARKRAKADPKNAALQRRAARLEAAVARAGKGQRAVEYMQGVANAFLDPEAQGYDEAAEIVFHELWARGFEKYIGTGSAPSEGLRTAFAKFAKYITSIYTSLRRLNVEVSPEVADVFDRLLATEDALNSERRGSLYQISPGVLDGATPAEARELRRLAAEAEDEARTQMLRREENALRKAARDQRAARREELTEQYTEEVAAEPVYAAAEIVRTGALLDGTPTGTGKIARAEVIAVAGAEAADRISNTLISGRNAPDNAMPLGELAMLSGFPDVTSLVDALADPETRSMADEVAARVEAQLQTEFGAETDPAALQEQALEAVQNERFQKLQQLQLRILRRLAAEPLARVSRRQAEQVGAPAPAADQAAEAAAQAAQGAARTSAEAVQANLQRIRSNVQRQANAGQRRAQAAAGRQTRGIQRNIDPAAITEAARRYVAGMKVQKATPARYKQAASRLTIKIERAIAARNYTEASALMEQRALNLAVSQEAARVQTMLKAKRARWRTLTARSDKRLSANYDMAWINAIRVALEPLGLARASRTNYSAAEALADLQQVEPALYVDIMQQIDAVGRDAQIATQADPKDPVRALTVERLTEIFDLADQLLANARNSHGLLVEGRRVEFGKIAADVSIKVDNRRDVAQKQRRVARRGDRRLSRSAEAFADTVSGFAAGLLRIEIWARDMDNGDPRGPMTRYLVRPIMQAVDRYTEARLDPLAKLGALLKDQKGLLRDQPIKADELAPGWSFRNKGELLMAVLNTGNPSNMRKLLMGGGSVNGRWSSWTSTQDSSTDLDTSRWDAFLARAFADGTLTKADMDAVQGIWDIFEDTKPQAQAAHQKMFGYRFVEVPSQEVVTPVGTYRGGYVPAVLDRLTNPNSDKFDAQEAMSQQSNASMFPGAEKGFTVARTDATYVLDLDITRLPTHFDRVMKFTHLGPAVQQAARLVNNDEFRAQVDRVNANTTTAAIIPWLQRTVRQQVAAPATNVKALRLLERGAGTLDRRVGMHIMAANVKNAVEQLTGFFPALARVPAKHLIAAGTTWKYNGESARRHMLEASPFMRRRIEIGANETLNLVDNIMREPGLLAKTQDAAVRYSYFAQQLVANAMEPTIWLAAERQAMETVYPKAYAEALARTGNDTEADAAAKAEVYAYADEVVRSTQGSTRPSDVSGIEGTTALMRIFLRFYSFFNTQGNAFVAERNIARNSDLGWTGRTGRAFYAYTMILAVPAILSKLLGTALSGELDELEDEELLPMAATILLGSQVEMVAGTVPFVGQALSIPYGRLFTDTPFDDGMRGSAGLSVASRAGVDVVDLIADIVDPETDVETAEGLRVVLNATGLLLGLPTNWINKPLRYAERVRNGDADPEGLVDLVQGILTGRDGTER